MCHGLMFHILSQNHLIDPAGVKWSPLGWDMTGQDTWFHLHWNLYKEVILQQGNENADRKEKGSQEAKNECYSNTLQQRKKEQGIRDQTTMRDATSPQMPFICCWGELLSLCSLKGHLLFGTLRNYSAFRCIALSLPPSSRCVLWSLPWPSPYREGS